ncbi:hypothetical protein O9992_18635 [Vibrio lentus]|nr:hypothetical protein [Vibrio lentus]
MFGLEPVFGLLSGSILIGGRCRDCLGAQGYRRVRPRSAMEIGIASATFGLILASLMGSLLRSFSSSVTISNQLTGNRDQSIPAP